MRGIGDAPFLDRAAIQRAIDQAGATLFADVAPIVDSTNSELLRRGAHADVHRVLLAAECQTAGRGRRGRDWLTFDSGSLVFSLGWRFDRRPPDWTGLSLAVGVALARALEAAGYRDIELKWPNDLLHGGCKLAGILVELSGAGSGRVLAIVGVGLNVCIPATVRGNLAVPVADLASIAGCEVIDRNVLLGRTAVGIAASLERYSHEGFSPFRTDWLERDALRDREVQIVLPDGSTADGVAAGVGADGALIVEADGRRTRLLNGEVSVRPVIRSSSVAR